MLPFSLEEAVTLRTWRYSGISALHPRTMEQQDKVDVACGLSDLECNMGKETGAPLVVGPGLRGRARHRGRGHRCATRTQAR